MPKRASGLDEVLEVVRAALGGELLLLVQAAYEDYRVQPKPRGRSSSAVQARAEDLSAVTARVRKAAEAVVELEFRVVRTTRARALQQVLQRVKADKTATLPAAIADIDAECAAVKALGEAARKDAGSRAAARYAVRDLAFSGNTVHVIQQLLHIPDHRRAHADDAVLLQKLPHSQAALLHQLLLGALLVHEERLLRAAADPGHALGDAAWEHMAHRARGNVALHFCQLDRNTGVKERITELEAAVLGARRELEAGL